MDEEPESPQPGAGLQKERSPGRRWLALGLLAAVAALAWETMDPGKLRSVVLVLLAFFAARILLAGFASR